MRNDDHDDDYDDDTPDAADADDHILHQTFIDTHT